MCVSVAGMWRGGLLQTKQTDATRLLHQHTNMLSSICLLSARYQLLKMTSSHSVDNDVCVLIESPFMKLTIWWVSPISPLYLLPSSSPQTPLVVLSPHKPNTTPIQSSH